MSFEDHGPSVGEQGAFSEVHDLITKWEKDSRYPLKELGIGVLGAALVCLRKAISDKEIAELLYERADQYGTRDD